MALTKYKIGDLITTVDERNTIGIRDFYGININKEFMPTVANTEGLDERKYKVVRKNRFVYSGMQTGRDECIRISMYTKDKPILVSPAYVTFEVTALSTVLPLYFFLRFLTKEKDRYGAFCSDGSIRSNLDWEVFCDMNIELPSIEIQQKYVDVYNAMLANQQSYEHGLDDLKLTCDAYIEELRRKTPCEKIGKYLSECNERNNVGLTVNNVRGIATSKEFIDTKANMDGVSLSNYKMIHPNEIAYISDTSRRGDKISLAIILRMKCIWYHLFQLYSAQIRSTFCLNICFCFIQGLSLTDMHALIHGVLRERHLIGMICVMSKSPFQI